MDLENNKWGIETRDETTPGSNLDRSRDIDDMFSGITIQDPFRNSPAKENTNKSLKYVSPNKASKFLNQVK